MITYNIWKRKPVEPPSPMSWRHPKTISQGALNDFLRGKGYREGDIIVYDWEKEGTPKTVNSFQVILMVQDNAELAEWPQWETDPCVYKVVSLSCYTYPNAQDPYVRWSAADHTRHLLDSEKALIDDNLQNYIKEITAKLKDKHCKPL